jgi:hypothetical protein
MRGPGNDGTGKKKTDKNGTDYWVYRLVPKPPGRSEWDPPQYTLADGKGERADPDTLHKVYEVVLNRLGLSKDHQENLAKRGLSAEQVTEFRTHRGYSTLGKGRGKAAYAVVQAGLEKFMPKVPGLFVQPKQDGGRYWSIASRGGMLIPVRDSQGRIIALMVRLDEDEDGRYRYLSSKDRGGASPGSPVHVPLFDGDKTTVRVTEGPLKADFATVFSGVLTIGLPSAGMWRLAAAVLEQLGAKVVRLAYDADAGEKLEVAKYLQQLAKCLKQKGFALELERWNLADGKGIDDLLASGKTPEVLTGAAVFPAIAEIKRSACKTAKVGKARSQASLADGANGKPSIIVNDRQLPDITADAVSALSAANNPPRLFQRGGAMARLQTRQKDKAPFLQLLDAAMLRGSLARAANWIRFSETNDAANIKNVSPPVDVVRDVEALPEYDLPYLQSVVECPVFAPDGELVATPGYHPGAQLWYHPSGLQDLPPVPTNPTREEIDKAKDLLLVELLGDFPFQDDASLAHTLAALLLPFVRPMVDGPTPLHLLDAPVEGTGKTLLSICVALVSTGRPAEGIAEAGSHEEWRKRITAALVEAAPHFFLDNINQVLDSGALASALTARVWKDRVLGVSKTVALPVLCVWLASGNNVRLSREMIRRTLWIRLDSKTDAPWERTDFRHPNLITWARANRPSLVWAALVLCQAWIAAGKPAGKQTLGMFESWAEVMGGILDVAQVPGLLANAKNFRKTATDKTDEWRCFVLAWWKEYQQNRKGIADLYTLAVKQQLLDSVLGDKEEKSQRTRLGIALSKVRDRVFGEYRIEAAEEDHSGRKQYQLVKVPPLANPPTTAASTPLPTDQQTAALKEELDSSSPDEEEGQWSG